MMRWSTYSVSSLFVPCGSERWRCHSHRELAPHPPVPQARRAELYPVAFVSGRSPVTDTGSTSFPALIVNGALWYRAVCPVARLLNLRRHEFSIVMGISSRVWSGESGLPISPQLKSLDTFDFPTIPSLNKALGLGLAACQRGCQWASPPQQHWCTS